MVETIRRAEHPGAWGPLSPEALRWRLGIAHRLYVDSCNRQGRHPSDAHYAAWQAADQAVTEHEPMQVARLPWHAQQALKRVQSLTFWPAV